MKLSILDKLVNDRKHNLKEEDIVNKMALAALGIGAAYLMQNKDARNKLMKQVETFTGMSMGMNKNSGTGSSS